jgi:hypothetical protein
MGMGRLTVSKTGEKLIFPLKKYKEKGIKMLPP